MPEISRNTQQHWAMYLLAAWREDDDTEEFAPRASELFEYDVSENLFSDAGDSAFNDEQSLSATLSDLFHKDVVTREDASERSNAHTSYAYSLTDSGIDLLQNVLEKPTNKPRILGAETPTKTTVASTTADTSAQEITFEEQENVEELFDDDGMLDIEKESDEDTVPSLSEEILDAVKKNTLRHWTLYLIGELSDPTPKDGMTRLDLYDAQHPNADIFKAPDSMSPTITTLIDYNLLEEVDTRDRYTAYNTTSLGEKLLERYGAPTQKQNRHSVENFTRNLPHDKNAVQFFVEGDGSEVEDEVTYRTITLGDDNEVSTNNDTEENTTETDSPTIIDSDGVTVNVDVSRETLVDALRNVDEHLVADMLDESMTDTQAALAIETIIETVAILDN